MLQAIRQEADFLGFNRCNVASVEPYVGIEHYDSYLAKGHHAGMSWMVRSRPPRARPDLLLPGAKSIVTLGVDYRWPRPERPNKSVGRVSAYAWGRDYHKLIGKRLKKLGFRLKDLFPELNLYWGVDSRPFIERAWAERSGLGFVGKNTMLISPGQTSFFFLAMLMLDVDLPSTEPLKRNFCGKCRKCLDFCPTDAFVGPFQLDARKCISYLTIEHKGSIPTHLRSLMGDWIFGCDLCQEVCPHNHKTPEGKLRDLAPREGHAWIDLAWILSASDDEILKKYEGTPLRRAGPIRLKRNAAVVAGNINAQHLHKHLRDLCDGSVELLREHARWALDLMSKN